MKQRILSIITLFFLLGAQLAPVFAATVATQDEVGYTVLRSIDLGTFNEYRYKITEKFFLLRDRYQLNNTLEKVVLEDIGVLANTGYKYLPDNLKNKNYLRQLLTDLQKGVQEPNNDTQYTQILKSIADYLEKVDIQSITGSIEAIPASGNAPLNTTFRAQVKDPSGTQIPTYNYTWWIDNAGQKIIIGRGTNLNYTFREEGNYSVFLDVVSNHRNSEGNIDILPFRSRAEVQVKEKIASLIIKVNSETLVNQDELKFTPADASYGLLFDATSSTPTGGAKFTSTDWDFGNGVKKKYNGAPKVERVRYVREGDYEVSLIMKTNEGKTVERNFIVSVHQPIATISVDKEDGYIGDKFTFSAKPSGSDKNLSYSWEIIDIDKDEVVTRKSGKVLTYTFVNKGKFNVRLNVTQASGESDVDTTIIYINSKAPIAEFVSTIPQANKPNKVKLDASRSHDPDFSDDGNLVYTWYIDGNKVNLENANTNGSIGYYVFDSVGNHDVNLEVRDPDGIVSLKKLKVEVKSILSVDFFAFPRVIQRENFMKFVAESPEAQIYEWDFGDGSKEGGNKNTINHKFLKSGTFTVILKVIDKDNTSNTYKKTVYVGDSENPLAVLDISLDSNESPLFEANACNGKGAYLVDRANPIKFDASESINIDGETSGVEYTWKIGVDKFSTSQSLSHKFDEIGCFPVKLTVKSDKNGRTNSMETYVEVRNLLPTLSTLAINVTNPESDPLIIDVAAQGAEDKDGVIQSYLWYYYTDTDTEPQDFRSTVKPGTTFVIPKITGNYYFVVVLKDNNEARVTSEEITGSKFFTTITGDNINTPLVDLKASDTNVALAEEVKFSATAKDILGQDLTAKARYSWDFDGDGFYDMETSENTVSYKFSKSGTFYSKVKVKYKGLSTTKNVTLNVSNKLVADFDYISIGNKYIFFDTSFGQVENYSWELGDGTKMSGKSFVYTYEDGKASHEVKLKIVEGTRTKEVTKTVVKNVKNILGARSEGINLFSSPLVIDGTITLELEGQKAFLYLGESKGDIAGYAIDIDTDIDADLNGSKDDDADNKGTGSYTSGDVTEVLLSNLREQKVRVFLTDTTGAVIDSQDITIIKNYIEDKVIDLDTIVFDGVSAEEKQTIDTLKELIGELPQAQKLKAMEYIQRLQESWNDDIEKTRIIIEFETYLIDSNVEKADDMFQLLESLLVVGQADTSEKAIALQALSNLIPDTIVCDITAEYPTCRAMLVSKLDAIYESNDIELNKALGTEILTIVANSEDMTTAQKLDFKAILKSFVYGGVDKIPDDEKQAVIDESPDQTGGSRLISVLASITYWVGLFILIFIVIIGLYYVYYKISNRDGNVGFQDFIIDKTSFKKTERQKEVTKEKIKDTLDDDVLGDSLGKKVEPEISSSIDPLDQTQGKNLKSTIPEDTSPTQVPDWLAGNFSTDTQVDTPQKQEEVQQVSGEIATPVPLVKNNEVETPKEEIKTVIENEKIIEEETKIDDPAIPDWLKQDFGTIDEAEKKIPQESLELDQSIQQAEDIIPHKDISIIDEEDDDTSVPDWLKGSFDTDPEDTSLDDGIVEEDAQEEILVQSPDNTASTPAKKRNRSRKKKTKVVENTSSGEQKESPVKDTKVKEDTPQKNDELWDDGMKVPDWLKTDDDV